MSTQQPSSELKGSVFNFLASLFKRHHARCVIVGGYALIVNKVQRMTFDIDFITTADDCARIEPDLIKAGYSIFNRQEAFVQFKGNKYGLRDIDFLIADRHTVAKLITGGKKVAIAGEQFIVPSPKHLIAMKLHSIAGNRGREIKDFPDVVQLMKAHAIDPAKADVKEMFVKYQLMDLFDKVLKEAGVRNGKSKGK